MTTSADPTDLLSLAVGIAREAGDLLRSYAARTDLRVTTKSTATDPVSEADQAAEQLISDRVAAARPDDGMLGEEQAGNRAGTSGLRWVVDPLDGTVNFLYGIPQWAVSIGVEDAAGAVVGVVHDPTRDETFTAVRGGGAWLQGRRLRVSDPTSFATSLVATGFGYDPALRQEQARLVQDLIGEVRDVRRLGSAALDLCWLAAGHYDGYAEFGLNPWDRCAGALIAAEAGATVSDRAHDLAGRRGTWIVAGGPAAHAGLDTWLTRHGALPA